MLSVTGLGVLVEGAASCVLFVSRVQSKRGAPPPTGKSVKNGQGSCEFRTPSLSSALSFPRGRQVGKGAGRESSGLLRVLIKSPAAGTPIQDSSLVLGPYIRVRNRNFTEMQRTAETNGTTTGPREHESGQREENGAMRGGAARAPAARLAARRANRGGAPPPSH